MIIIFINLYLSTAFVGWPISPTSLKDQTGCSSSRSRVSHWSVVDAPSEVFNIHHRSHPPSPATLLARCLQASRMFTSKICSEPRLPISSGLCKHNDKLISLKLPQPPDEKTNIIALPRKLDSVSCVALWGGLYFNMHWWPVKEGYL